MTKQHLFFPFFISSVLFATSCTERKGPEAPPLEDSPQVAQVKSQTIKGTIPAYGIAIAGGRSGVTFQVNIEAADSEAVKVGQKATSFIIPQKIGIDSVVTRVLRNVSGETGQALAWLSPVKTEKILLGEFVFSSIVTSEKKSSLAVPLSCILIRRGKTTVAKQTLKGGKAAFEIVEVKIGASTESEIEILSGLKLGDSVVTRGGLGILYPNFKSSGGGD